MSHALAIDAARDVVAVKATFTGVVAIEGETEQPFLTPSATTPERS